jgi:hypothetical protein
MDQKLLNALSNLSDGLEAIAEALKAKSGDKSPTTAALQSGDFSKSIKEINVGVKQLLSDSKKILKNQETIIQLSKKSSTGKKSEFETAGGDKKQESNIKKGVGTILLIAVAVLAIGMAFKLVGGINFLSVIGLSIAILLVAKAFEKVAALKMSLKEAAVVSASIILMAFGITVSSWIMSKISPISMGQSLTAILIATGFSLMSPAIKKIIKAFDGMSFGGIIKTALGLMLVLPAIAAGITVSSWILRMITPISFAQSITAILITAMFTVLSFGIKKLLRAFGSSIGSLVKAVIFLPLILPAIALGITLSSWVLKKITVITPAQGISAILIGAMFAVVGFGLKKLIGAFGGNNILAMGAAILFLPFVMEAVADGIVRASSFLKNISEVGWTQALSAIMIAVIFTVISFGLKMLINAMDAIDDPLGILLVPLILPAMAYAIQLSSDPLSKVTTIKMEQFLTSLGIAALFVVFALALKLIGPSIDKIGIGAVIKIPLMFTALSGAIWASSKILAKTTVMEDEFLKKLLKYTIVLALAISGMAGVSYLLNKIGFTNILKGVLAIPVLAGVIALTSGILSLGTYKDGNYPSLNWALGVGASIAAFGLGAAALGLLVFGPQALLFAAGLGAVAAVAATVVASSHILAEGNYKKAPDLLWVLGVSSIMSTFASLVGILGIIPDAWIEDGINAVSAVSKSIVDSAWTFSSASAAFVGGPTKEWAERIGIAIGAFSPVYAMLMANGVASIFGGGGVGPDEFSTAIVTVSKGIIDAASFFADPKNKGVWNAGPTKAWAEGVGTAIGAFSPVYAMLMANGIAKLFGDGGIGPEEFSTAIVTVSTGIMTAAKEFAKAETSFTEGMYPSKQWGEGVGSALAAFSPVYTMLMANGISKLIGGGGIGPVEFSAAILTVSKGIITAAQEFATNTATFNEGMYPSKKWGEGVGAALQAFAPVFTALSQDTGFFTSGAEVISNMVNGVLSIAGAIVGVAMLFSVEGLKWTSYPDKTWAEMVGAGVSGYVIVARDIENMGVDIQALSILQSTVEKLVRVAKTVSANSKYFNATINPNLMKSISSNLFYYMAVAERLNSKKGGIGSMIRGAFSGDPIINMANGMLHLARAYDKLATSLAKMGSAMDSINDKKISQMERISRIQNGGRGVSSVFQMPTVSRLSPEVSPASTYGSSLLDNTFSAKSKKSDASKPGKYGDNAKQNDMIIELLTELNTKLGPGSVIEAMAQKKLAEKKDSSLQ